VKVSRDVAGTFENRGLEDVLMLVCDGLKGLPDAVEAVWPRTIVQTCVVRLLRNSFRYAACQDWDKIAKALKPVCTAPSEDAAMERLLEFQEAWGKKYPAIVKLRSDAWGRVRPPSSPSTLRSARSSARPMRSRVSTPASGRPSAPAGTSPTRPPP